MGELIICIIFGASTIAMIIYCVQGWIRYFRRWHRPVKDSELFLQDDFEKQMKDYWEALLKEFTKDDN